MTLTMEIVVPIPVSDRIKYLGLRVILREHSFVRIGLLDKQIPCFLLTSIKRLSWKSFKAHYPGQPENNLEDIEFERKSIFWTFRAKLLCCTMTNTKRWILPVAWLFSMASFGACFSGMLLWIWYWRISFSVLGMSVIKKRIAKKGTTEEEFFHRHYLT